MNAPLYEYGLFGDDFSLLIALLTGIGFGFFLERGGFGSARKLAAQFYLTDMTVFKVMFTAIVTAMLGLFWLSWLGVVDYALVSIPPTFLVPQLVGGIVFGTGFVMGGYCPGTSCVASSTGKLDGGVHLVGMITGILLFGEAFSFLETFYNSSSMGVFTLPQVFGLSEGLTVFLIVLAAIGGFMAAERIEARYQREPDQPVA